MKGQLFDIEHGSFVDGPGIRTTVFFKGCNLNCRWCHNPESQSFLPQRMVFADKCVGCGKCKTVCPHGQRTCDLCGKCALYCPQNAIKISGAEYTESEVLSEILRDRDFYGETGGVTFSGGECMLQIDFLQVLLKACKENGIGTAVDTAGNVSWERFEAVIPYTDLFLYDVKLMDSAAHKTYTGVGNECILDNLRRLLQAKNPIWIRVPIVPGVNDTETEIRKVKAYIDRYGKAEKIELLPYHRLGENKYAALGQTAAGFTVPSAEKMERLKAVLGE